MKVTWPNRSADTRHPGKEAANRDSSLFIQGTYGISLLFSIESGERADAMFSGTFTPALKETVQMAVAGAPLMQIEDIAPMVRQTSTRYSTFLLMVFRQSGRENPSQLSKSGEL